MRFGLLLIFVLVFAGGVGAQTPPHLQKARSLPPTTAQWDSTVFDFGIVNEGPAVVHTYTICNTGDQPLHLVFVKTDCGCTLADYTRDPIPPDSLGTVVVRFNTELRGGTHDKKIYVFTNTAQPETILHLRGRVKGYTGIE